MVHLSRKKDRKFMEIAVEEMRKSRSEHKIKYDPMVGAILIGDDGNELGRTHRGNLRVGDHAEYTLIERFLSSKDLENSTLYVTLEPCISRKPPKKSCAERIASARIRRVVIGMTDPNPDIQGKGITFLQRNDITVGFFDLDLTKLIMEENKYFIKQYEKASKVKVDTLDKCEGPSKKEKEPVHSASLKDLSYDMIRDYLAARKKSYKIPSSELWTFFYKNGFLAKSHNEDTFIPTVAGMLLFGKSPEDILVQSKVKAEAHDGDKIITSDIAGPLLILPDRIKDFLERNMKTYTEIKGFKRIDVPEYPWEALREAVINALVHRDYNEGARIMIKLFPDKISIKSPGLPLQPLSLEKIRAYNAPPYSRNPRIAETFCYLKLMEERGWGFPRMRDILLKHNLPPPEFNYDSGYFVVTFFAHERTPTAVHIPPEITLKLNDRQKKILNIIQQRGSITRSECAKKFKINEKTALRDLNALKQHGIIEKKGKGPSTYYILSVE